MLTLQKITNSAKKESTLITLRSHILKRQSNPIPKAATFIIKIKTYLAFNKPHANQLTKPQTSSFIFIIYSTKEIKLILINAIE